MKHLRLIPAAAILGLFLGLGVSCGDIPDLPSGPQPSAIPSEAPGDRLTPCEEVLQCAVDNTNDNAVRRDAQAALNELALSREPQFTQICEREAAAILLRAPECRKN
jgi:hypothetical protein